MSMFKPAVKHESKLRLAIAGPSGAGKTYTSLAIATSLANGGKVAVVDTEHGSAEKYSGIFPFDVLKLDAPFHPDRFSEAIQMAAQEGYSVVVLDSLSHAWNGAGGALELVEQFSRKYKGNSYAAWGDVTPIQNRLIESIVGAKLHVIATMRSKQDYILIDRNGKQMPQKVGMAPIQRDGFEYEFDVFLDMDVENNAVVTKTRCPELTGKVINKPGKDLANTLRGWLSGEPVVEVKSNGKPAPVAADLTWDELNNPATPINASPRDIAIRDGKQFVPQMAKQEGKTESEIKDIAKLLGMSAISKKEDERGKQWDTIVDYIYLTRNEKLPHDLALAVINDAITMDEARKQVAKQPALIDADTQTDYAE